MKTDHLGRYLTPEIKMIALDSESVLCLSGEMWYKKGGQGDFTYGIETDDTWV